MLNTGTLMGGPAQDGDGLNVHALAANSHKSIDQAVVIRDDEEKTLLIELILHRGTVKEETIQACEAACGALSTHFEGWRISAIEMAPI